MPQLRFQTHEGVLTQHDDFKVAFRFSFVDQTDSSVITKAFTNGDTLWEDELELEVPPHLAAKPHTEIVIEAVDMEDPKENSLFARCRVLVFNYVWQQDYAGLVTCCPLVDGAGHTIGRLHFRFLGNTEVIRYPDVLDVAWQFKIKEAALKTTIERLPPEEWDPRVKITFYPGKITGSTSILAERRHRRNPVWGSGKGETLVFPYEPPLESDGDLTPCVGLKVLNQNLGLPNDLLGRCVILLPVQLLMSGDAISLDQNLHFGGGTLSFSISKLEDVDPDAALLELRNSTIRISGGLSSQFPTNRLKSKLERENTEDAALQLLMNNVARTTAGLDLQKLYRENGTGGGSGSKATKVAMSMDTLRTVLDAWGMQNGAGLGLGKEIPGRWLQPLAYSNADPLPSALKLAKAKAAEEKGDDGEGEDDEFGGDEWGDGEGSGDEDEEEHDPDELLGQGVEPVRNGIAFETLVDAIGRFSLKHREMESQLDHARGAALFAEWTEGEESEFQEKFQRWDVDSSGAITREELERGIMQDGLTFLLPLPTFHRMDYNSDNKIIYEEFHSWLKREIKRRTRLSHMRQRTEQLAELRQQRKQNLTRLLTHVDKAPVAVAAPSDEEDEDEEEDEDGNPIKKKKKKPALSAQTRRLVFIQAAGTVANANNRKLSKAAEARKLRTILNGVEWTSSTSFVAETQSHGEQAAKIVMEKLAELCDAEKAAAADEDNPDDNDDSGKLWCDPDFGPMLVRPCSQRIVTNYDKWLADHGVKPPPELRERKQDEHGTTSLYRPTTNPGRSGLPNPGSIVWRRITEDEDNPDNQPELFKAGAGSGDAKQGKLGDCWFIGAMSLIATRDDLLDDVFYNWLPSGPARQGIYVLRFYKGSDWHYVIMDDKLPTSGSGSLIFASGVDPLELWVPFIEKAYAKLHGTYCSLEGGYVDEGLRDLTGLPIQKLRLPHSLMPLQMKRRLAAEYGGSIMNIPQGEPQPANEEEEEAITFRMLNRHIRVLRSHGSMLGCSHRCPGGSHSWGKDARGVFRLTCNPKTDKKSRIEADLKNGIVQRHAYSIIDAKFVKEVNEVVVRVRNPWGKREWTQKYSDVQLAKDEKMFKIMQQAFATVTVSEGQVEKDAYGLNSQDGTFLMSFSDWMEHYTHLFACIDFPVSYEHDCITGFWKGPSSGGPTNDISSWRRNPMFDVTVSKETAATDGSEHGPEEGYAHLLVELCQKDPRRECGAAYNKKLLKVAFCIIDDEAAAAAMPTDFIPGSKPYIPQPYIRKARCMSVSAQVPAGNVYTVIPYTDTAGPAGEGEFYLTVYCSHGVKVAPHLLGDIITPKHAKSSGTKGRISHLVEEERSLKRSSSVSSMSAAIEDIPPDEDITSRLHDDVPEEQDLPADPEDAAKLQELRAIQKANDAKPGAKKAAEAAAERKRRRIEERQKRTALKNGLKPPKRKKKRKKSKKKKKQQQGQEETKGEDKKENSGGGDKSLPSESKDSDNAPPREPRMKPDEPAAMMERRLELAEKEKLFMMRRDRAFRAKKSELLVKRRDAREQRLTEQRFTTSFGALLGKTTEFKQAPFDKVAANRLFSLHGVFKGSALLAMGNSDSKEGDEGIAPADAAQLARVEQERRARKARSQSNRKVHISAPAARSNRGQAMPRAERSASGAPPSGSAYGSAALGVPGASAEASLQVPLNEKGTPLAEASPLLKPGLITAQPLTAQDVFRLRGARRLMGMEAVEARLKVKLSAQPWKAADASTGWATAGPDGDATWVAQGGDGVTGGEAGGMAYDNVCCFPYPGLPRGAQPILHVLVVCEFRSGSAPWTSRVVGLGQVKLAELICAPMTKSSRWISLSSETLDEAASEVGAVEDGDPALELSLMFMPHSSLKAAGAATGWEGLEASAAESKAKAARRRRLHQRRRRHPESGTNGETVTSGIGVLPSAEPAQEHSQQDEVPQNGTFMESEFGGPPDRPVPVMPSRSATTPAPSSRRRRPRPKSAATSRGKSRASPSKTGPALPSASYGARRRPRASPAPTPPTSRSGVSAWGETSQRASASAVVGEEARADLRFSKLQPRQNFGGGVGLNDLDALLEYGAGVRKAIPRRYKQ